ncbi:MAG: hypothetical protein AB7I50_08800 [Vicinamibacterales bacterium]
MVTYQVWLERVLRGAPAVADFMHGRWSWPAAESLHFVGLTLLFGSIAAWDLRLIGVARQVPVLALHRLIPFAVLGFLANASSGMLFLMTDPDQYIYNSAFHLKMVCLLLAGANVIVFYVTVFERVKSLEPGEALPPAARTSGAISLALWTAVIVCGRMITFYRPVPCSPGAVLTWLSTCVVVP